jgi:type VI secretion system protein ImpL
VLLAHTDAMLKQPLTTLPLNDALIAQARAVLNRQPLAEYSYNRLLRSKRVLAIPTWTVAENGGPESGRVFQMRSGKGLDTGVQGIYTGAGYHNVFLPLLPTITPGPRRGQLGAAASRSATWRRRCVTRSGCDAT